MLRGATLDRRLLASRYQNVASRGTVQFMDEFRNEFRDAELTIAQPDWSREQLKRWWDPGRQLLRSIRRYQTWKRRGGLLGLLGSKVAVLHYRFWSVVSASEIHLTCKLGGGLLLTHPNGVIIHPDAEVGANCLILQQVTLVAGVKVGNGVDIGAGAKIIRPVTIGDRARIGANAVVTKDVRPGATVVGIPAREIKSSNLIGATR